MNKEIGKETATMRIRKAGLNPDHPIAFKYPGLKVTITWDEKGEAEVPMTIGRLLLGPKYVGQGYEEVQATQKADEPEPEEAVHKTSRRMKVMEQEPKEEV